MAGLLEPDAEAAQRVALMKAKMFAHEDRQAAEARAAERDLIARAPLRVQLRQSVSPAALIAGGA